MARGSDKNGGGGGGSGSSTAIEMLGGGGSYQATGKTTINKKYFVTDSAQLEKAPIISNNIYNAKSWFEIFLFMYNAKAIAGLIATFFENILPK